MATVVRNSNLARLVPGVSDATLNTNLLFARLLQRRKDLNKSINPIRPGSQNAWASSFPGLGDLCMHRIRQTSVPSRRDSLAGFSAMKAINHESDC